MNCSVLNGNEVTIPGGLNSHCNPEPHRGLILNDIGDSFAAIKS